MEGSQKVAEGSEIGAHAADVKKKAGIGFFFLYSRNRRHKSVSGTQSVPFLSEIREMAPGLIEKQEPLHRKSLPHGASSLNEGDHASSQSMRFLGTQRSAPGWLDPIANSDGTANRGRI